MNNNTDDLVREIAAAEAELKRKLEALEDRVKGEMAWVKESVEGTFQTVKSVTSQLSLRHQMAERPLVVLGGSVLTGMLLARWWMGPPQRTEAPMAERYINPPPPEPSMYARLSKQFPDEVQAVKTVAFSYVLNAVARKASERYPHLVDKIDELERQLKEKLSGA